jgi:hypothetical protein
LYFISSFLLCCIADPPEQSELHFRFMQEKRSNEANNVIIVFPTKQV